MSADALQQCLDKMTDAGISQPAIDNFAHYWRQCADGVTGVIPEASIRPLTEVAALDQVQLSATAADEALRKTVIIKLNGGLGTSMGLDQAKTLLPVRDGKNFLDLIIEQVRSARRTHQARLPLLFMNSFRTRDDTLAHLAGHPDLAVDGLPLDFLQNAEPKLRADDLSPVEWPEDPSLEWCPPGHGDIYPALWGSGLLDALIDAGFRYASIANGDNLGAAPYAAELCPRTVNDRKGGHLAVRIADGQLILRDTAQTAPEEMDFFTDEFRHPYFHTNNLWVELTALRDLLEQRSGVLGLPLIRNDKTVDPADPASTKVYQLESAMGAAIEVFPGSTAIVVGRDRFLPVKTTNELMLLRSDLFELAADGRLVAQAPIPRISLDGYYKLVDDFDALVPVVPSLRRATSLEVKGEWHFDVPSAVVGEVVLEDAGEPRQFR